MQTSLGTRPTRTCKSRRIVLSLQDEPGVRLQVKGTFLGFQTSGELFDRFAREVKEKIKLNIRAVGTIRVDEVYTVSPLEPGKKVA